MNQTETNEQPDKNGDDEAVDRKDKAETPADAGEEALAARLAEAEERAEREREAALRAKAELENYRRRAAREMENARRFALERFMGDLLDVRDSLERGLEVGAGEQADVSQLVEGTALTFRILDKVLATHGLQEIDPVGEAFDPERHEAMSLVPTDDQAPDTVVTVVQKGFLLNDRLLRPARVLVATASG